MDIIDCEHDKVLIQYTEYNGFDTMKSFLSYLLDEDIRINEENNREIQQQNIYNNDNILGPENLDNTELAVWQWLNDNPGWWQE